MRIENILALSLDQRKEWFTKAKTAYYETSKPILSDDDYDLLEESVNDENYFVGTNSRHNKSEHRNRMLSLKKKNINKDGTNENEILRQAYESLSSDKRKIGLALSLKYDGLAMNVEFKDGKLKQIVTRGSGDKGVNRTNKLRHIIDGSEKWQSFIELFQTGEVRCECILEFDTFEKTYAPQGYDHPRNAASGIVSDLDLNRGKDDLKLIPLEGIDKDNNLIAPKFINDLPNSKNCIYSIDTFQELVDAFEKFKMDRKNLNSPSDGLVLSKMVTDRFTHDGHYPDHAISIKFASPSFETVVEGIKWNLQKTGRYVPIVFFKPFIVDGRTIKKCSGHNLEYLIRNEIVVGSNLTIKLSGDIIPCIVRS